VFNAADSVVTPICQQSKSLCTILRFKNPIKIRIETNMRQFLSTLHDTDLDQTIEFSIGGKTLTSPIGELLQHTANHAIHHRGQVSLLLRLLGYEPALFDLLLYHSQRRGTPIV
jgi:uncharacterized damage-inducible protein DinB